MPRAIEDLMSGKFPTPFIERVYVQSQQTNDYEDNTSDGLQVDIAIYLPEIDGAEPTEQREAINDLIFYAVYIVGDPSITAISRREESIFEHMKKMYMSDASFANNAMSDIKANPSYHDNLIAYGYGVSTEASYTNATYAEDTNSSSLRAYCKTNYNAITFDEFSDEGELVIVEETERFYKYIASISIPMIGDYTLFDDLMDAAYQSDDRKVDYKSINVYAFSSTIEHDLESVDVFSIVNENKNLINKRHSGLAYEQVFDDGSITSEPRLRWFLADTLWDGIPMIATDGTTREYSDFDRERIVEAIYTIMPQDPVTEEGQEILENLMYLVEADAYEPTFLTRLNEYRRAFPYKEDAFYTKLTELVANENNVLSDSSPLQKKLIRNFKVIDARQVEFEVSYDYPDVEEFAAGTYLAGDDETMDSERIYENSIEYFTRYAYSSAVVSGTDLPDYEDAEDMFLSYGFIFFDFEKAVRYDTALAGVFNIQSLEAWFGKSLINASLRFDYTRLRRFYDGGKIRTIETHYDTHSPSYPFPLYTAYSTTIVGGYTGDPGEVEVYPGANSDGTQGFGDYSYCMLAPFSVPGMSLGAATTDYRLACFAFQDYYDLDSTSDATVTEYSNSDTMTSTSGDDMSIESYDFQIVTEDKSADVLMAITGSYYTAVYEEFQAYYDYANEYCSYNDVEGYFNEFFVNAMDEIYPDDSAKPWMRMPVIYNVHQDILYSEFGGDSEKLLDTAQSISDRIGPYTGNLVQLETFKDQIEALWTQFYSDGGLVETAIESMIESRGATTIWYNQEWKSLPEIIYSGDGSTWLPETAKDYGADTGDDGEESS